MFGIYGIHYYFNTAYLQLMQHFCMVKKKILAYDTLLLSYLFISRYLTGRYLLKRISCIPNIQTIIFQMNLIVKYFIPTLISLFPLFFIIVFYKQQNQISLLSVFFYCKDTISLKNYCTKLQVKNYVGHWSFKIFLNCFYFWNTSSLNINLQVVISLVLALH